MSYLPGKYITYYTFNSSSIEDYTNTDCGIENLSLNILVDNATELCPELFLLVSSLKNEYLITFTDTFFDTFINQKLLADIYILLSLNNHAGGNQLLPIFSKDKISNYHENISKVVRYFSEQSLYELKILFFVIPPQGAFLLVENFLLLSLKSFTNLSAEEFNKNRTSSIEALIVTDCFQSYEGLQRLMKKIRDIPYDPETNFLNINPGKIELESEIELWRKRSSLYLEFISISKAVQQKEYYEMLEWYNNEYEILPLWYKRFGHIIKVILGKRSFRSLFSNHVKKYNN